MHALVVVGTAALAITLSMFAGDSRVSAQQTEGIGQEALSQIAALAEEKAARTPAKRKLDSQVLYAVGQTVLDELVALGAEIIEVNERYNQVRLRIDLSQVEALAAIPQVSFVEPKREAMTNRVEVRATAIRPLGDESVDALRERKLGDRAHTLASIRQALQLEGALPNVGSQNSEGDPKHRANTSRSAYGVNGTGVRIGVLSDGVELHRDAPTSAGSPTGHP